MRSPEYLNGRREGVKWAVTWLHKRAGAMNDWHAQAILNTAAFNMGFDAKQQNIDTPETQSLVVDTDTSNRSTTYGN